MGKRKRSGKKKDGLAVLTVLAVLAAYVLYSHGYFDWWLGEFASGAGKSNPAMCGKAGITIESVECEDKIMHVALSNTGRMPLGGNFLGVVSTGSMQVFVANNTESVIRPDQVGTLSFVLEGLDGPIQKVTVAFQACDNVVAEYEKISMVC